MILQPRISDILAHQSTDPPNKPEMNFAPSWIADQDFDDQFWTSGLESGEQWQMEGEIAGL